MAKEKFYEGRAGMPTEARYEDWDRPENGMPEDSLGDSRKGIDEQIRKDNLRKSKIKPRGI